MNTDNRFLITEAEFGLYNLYNELESVWTVLVYSITTGHQGS